VKAFISDKHKIRQENRAVARKPHNATAVLLNLMFAWATSSSLIVWIYLHSNFCGGLRKMHVFWNRVRNGPSRSSQVIDFGTNWKRVCDFLLVINSNLGPILPRFRDIAGFLLRRATPPLFHQNFGGVPLGPYCRCCGSKERRPLSYYLCN